MGKTNVTDQWSACSASSLTILVRIPMKSTVWCVKSIGFWKDRNDRKEALVGPFLKPFVNIRWNRRWKTMNWGWCIPSWIRDTTIYMYRPSRPLPISEVIVSKEYFSALYKWFNFDIYRLIAGISVFSKSYQSRISFDIFQFIFIPCLLAYLLAKPNETAVDSNLLRLHANDNFEKNI